MIIFDKIKIFGLVLSFISLVFVITEHYGLWDKFRGTDKLLAVYSRMNISYAKSRRNVLPDDPEWESTIKLIYKYSEVDFPKDKKPIAVWRTAATASAYQPVGPTEISEWTAPTTPILMVYKWSVGGTINHGDAIIIGSIGDFRNWIEQDKNDFKFMIQNIFLGVLSFLVATVLALSFFKK